ncbi:hypothetical protein EYF80_012779 [Liparis tanakae]|uniref:Uncharacterized protein n=1 Tax=Liparis tanakae TaxID=230148 RepID=A0A4Z2IIB1_9TELE|nr:hypothetical protein EYF80_012779 [Liparis tanakae]
MQDIYTRQTKNKLTGCMAVEQTRQSRFALRSLNKVEQESFHQAKVWLPPFMQSDISDTGKDVKACGDRNRVPLQSWKGKKDQVGSTRHCVVQMQNKLLVEAVNVYAREGGGMVVGGGLKTRGTCELQAKRALFRRFSGFMSLNMDHVTVPLTPAERPAGAQRTERVETLVVVVEVVEVEELRDERLHTELNIS